MHSPDADLIVIGAGIIGLATARAALRAHPRASVLVVEKETEVAQHQSGHNSGVVHSGVYYRPGSAKAELCRRGQAALGAFCSMHDIPIRRAGKVIVATEVAQLERLDELRRRAAHNDVAATVVGPRQLAVIEPAVSGVAALHVPGTAVVDFGAVTRALATEIADRGGTILTDWPVATVRNGGGAVTLANSRATLHARLAVNCGGLYSDQLARLAGGTTTTRIVPFRGEYRMIRPERAHLVRGLVYPVPDPALPFLGVHATRGIDGSVHLGPNAVLALSREGYAWSDVAPAELMDLARSPQLAGLTRRWWRTGITEVARSLWPRLLLREARRLLPDLEPADLTSRTAGVRAQAVRPDGGLVDDFAFDRTGRVLSVLNAPSPAATASLAIGEAVVEQLGLAVTGV